MKISLIYRRQLSQLIKGCSNPRHYLYAVLRFDTTIDCRLRMEQYWISFNKVLFANYIKQIIILWGTNCS